MSASKFCSRLASNIWMETLSTPAAPRLRLTFWKARRIRVKSIRPVREWTLRRWSDNRHSFQTERVVRRPLPPSKAFSVQGRLFRTGRIARNKPGRREKASSAGETCRLKEYQRWKEYRSQLTANRYSPSSSKRGAYYGCADYPK